MDINPDMVQGVTFLKEELWQVDVILNEMNTVTLPPMGHTSTLREKALLAGSASSYDEGGGNYYRRHLSGHRCLRESTRQDIRE